MEHRSGLERNTKQIGLVKRSPMYWRVTFDHPPLNIFGPETIPQLNEVVTALETDKSLKVVVFDSSVDGFFLTHHDFLAKLEDSTSLPPGATGLQQLPDMLVSGVNSRWLATCGLLAARRPSYRSGKSDPVWCRAGDPWRGCRV